MQKWLKHITEIGWFTATILIVFALCLWIPDYIIHSSDFIDITICLVLTILNAAIATFACFQTKITRNYSPMPIVCYLLLSGLAYQTHQSWQAQIAVLITQIIVVLILNSWRKQNAVEESFLSSLLLITLVMIIPDAVVFFPLLWLSFVLQRAFSLKVWLASITAIVVVAIYAIALNYTGWFDDFYFASLSQIITRSWIKIDTNLITIGASSIAGVLFLLYSFIDFQRDNTSVQSFIILYSCLYIISTILMFFPPAYFPSLIGISVFATSMLALSTFALKQQSVVTGITFLLLLIVCGGSAVFRFLI